MNDQRPAPAYLDDVRALMRQVVTVGDPSVPAAAIVAAVADHLETEDFATSLYLVWGALSDWEQDSAADAAREWLALDHQDREAVRRYFDHWLHDVCGYDRP